MALNFQKLEQEAHIFLTDLAEDLGYTSEEQRAEYIVRSVLHALRDRMTISESLDLLAQLPTFLKIIFIEDWKYTEKPETIETLDEFIDRVNEKQKNFYFVDDFDKYFIDEDQISTTLDYVSEYLSEGELGDIVSELPMEIKSLFSYY